ncbi:MAG TPA: alpha/beta hydrolase [Aldersonia sp.]
MSEDQARIVERRVSIGGVRTRTLSVAGEGPTILLLHGFSDSADSFRPLLARLAERRRRAVAVDLPGAGYAESLGRPVFSSLDRFADALVAEFAGAGGAVLVGNSLGGLVSLRAAARPGLPLVAVAGLGPAGLAYHRRLESFARWTAWLDPMLRLLDLIPIPTWLVRRAAQRLYQRRLLRGRGDADLARRYADHIGRRALVDIRRDLIAVCAEPSLLQPETLDAMAVPVLLIWGDRDHLSDVGGAPTLLDAVTHSRLVVLDDCGHCPQVEYPELVADLLSTLPTSAAGGQPTAPKITEGNR